ncbi:MAG: hypothetical protein HWE14_10410 [Flavobacteriia bacterium]|nr:hypothetical protein [Flavobacteriia bacterium]
MKYLLLSLTVLGLSSQSMAQLTIRSDKSSSNTETQAEGLPVLEEEEEFSRWSIALLPTEIIAGGAPVFVQYNIDKNWAVEVGAGPTFWNLGYAYALVGHRRFDDTHNGSGTGWEFFSRGKLYINRRKGFAAKRGGFLSAGYVFKNHNRVSDNEASYFLEDHINYHQFTLNIGYRRNYGSHIFLEVYGGYSPTWTYFNTEFRDGSTDSELVRSFWPTFGVLVGYSL